MQSDFERNRFRKIYWLNAVVLLIILTGWLVVTWQELSWRVAGAVGIVLAFLIIVYRITYGRLNSVYCEIENVSGIMTDIMEQGTEPPVEEYKEGTIGILYTNFYKMVGVLQESRNREMKEKAFLRDIISDISHQLKTPMSSLMVFVDLLLEDKVEEPDKQKQILTEAANQLNRMEWMVLSMLKLARIEAGAIQFEKKKTVLKQLLLQAAEGVQFLVKERGQELNIACASDCELECDGDWLVEAIINLLKNASDYSGENKRIWVEVEQSNVYTRIYVKDEGPGIPEEEIPNIFKRFYRVHSQVNPNSVGIGLSLTKSIVEGMGGSIHVKSEEGKYTWFVLTFVQ